MALFSRSGKWKVENRKEKEPLNGYEKMKLKAFQNVETLSSFMEFRDFVF